MIGRVAVLGAGGFAQELGDMLVACGAEILGCIAPLPDPSLPYPWLGNDDALAGLDVDVSVIAAIGEPSLRARVAGGLGRKLASFIHPTAWVAPSAQLGEGVIVYPHATIHAAVRLERGVMVNSNASVGHHTVVGEFSNINPGAALGGRITIGPRCMIGIGACVREALTITADVTIGAGAAVIGDLPQAGTYVGTPARRLR